MKTRAMTMTDFVIDHERQHPESAGEFIDLVYHARLACKRIDFVVGRGALAGAHGSAEGTLQTSYRIPDAVPHGQYRLNFQPFDGSSNLDINAPVGSIFSVLKAPSAGSPPAAAGLLQSGAQPLCAGYALYGAATMLVLTLGRGVHGFTLDRGVGEFILTHPNMRLPGATSEFAIDTSNERFWESPVKRYVAECLAGRGGVRGRDFNVRWIASLVAEVHRILIRGGLFMVPGDTRHPDSAGGLRLLYEANPMAMILEQAGGAASHGRGRLLDLAPTELHHRVPVILGCRSEVELIEQYHLEHDQGLDRIYSSPLFKERTLFIQN